jgi:uncharacterized protein with von Willebrand factor type A (vWA) domain
MLSVAASSSADPGRMLQARLAGFPGFLRANGFASGGSDAIDVLETTVGAGALDPRVLRWNLQALLCSRGDEWRRFDTLFDAYFLPPTKTVFAGSEAPGGAVRESPGRSSASTRSSRPRRSGSRPACRSSTAFSAAVLCRHRSCSCPAIPASGSPRCC